MDYASQHRDAHTMDFRQTFVEFRFGKYRIGHDLAVLYISS